ncbi:UPF0158 family protein [Streptomyces humicola]|uniref:UPF0158 family protein n=1 Tax=Streptomyces humicola TaxID=2953240 RepID=UPI0035565F2A
MEDFITSVDEPDLARFLRIAIQDPGAFRRFKNTLVASPAQLQQYWLFSAERQYGRARAWLADDGYHPAPLAASDPRALIVQVLGQHVVVGLPVVRGRLDDHQGDVRGQ